MAYGERRNGKLTGRWVCDAEYKNTDGSVDRWHKAFASKQEAEGAEAYFRATGQKPPHLVAGPSPETFAAVAERFKEKHREWLEGESNAQRLEFAMAHLGKLPVGMIRTHQLEDYVDTVRARCGRAGKPPATQTVNNYLNAVSKVLRYANRLELIPGMPEFPRKAWDGEERGVVPWAAEDAICARLVELGNLTEAFLVRVLAGTGMRCGELFAIEPIQIELVEQHGYSGILLRADQTKNGKPRWVPLVLDGCRKLKAIIASGQLGNHSQLYDKMTRAAKWCGEIPDASPHWLRHTANTRMLDTGADSMIVSEIMGHSTGRMTQRYYHPDKPRLFEVAEKVQGRCGEIKKTSAVVEFAPKAKQAISA